MTALGEKSMVTTSGIFKIEQQGETLIVTPTDDLSELAWGQIEVEAEDLLNQLVQASVKNVVLDFHQTDSFGSTALGFFLRLWKQVREADGQMAICNLSDHEKDILQATRLDSLWPINFSRPEALKAVGRPALSPRSAQSL
jgi:anti-anti-sigma factor